MRRRCTIVFSIAAFCIGLGSGVPAETPDEVLRVYETNPDTFDLVFASVMNADTATPLVSLNHRNGRTFFARKGESVGGYTVENIAVTSVDVFDPSLDATQKERRASVVLKGKNGESVTLDMGKPLPIAGLRAKIVSLARGDLWDVRVSDRLLLVNFPVFIVTEVNSESISLADTNNTYRIPMISEEEKSQIAAIWDKQKKNKAEKIRLAQEARQKADEEYAAQQKEQLARLAAAAAMVPKETTEVRFEFRTVPMIIGQPYYYSPATGVVPIPVAPIRVWPDDYYPYYYPDIRYPDVLYIPQPVVPPHHSHTNRPHR